MADIEMNSTGGQPPKQIFVNGVDLSMEVFDGSVELVTVGEGPTAQIGLRLTLAVSSLSVDSYANVPLTDHFPEAAALVRSTQDGDPA